MVAEITDGGGHCGYSKRLQGQNLTPSQGTECLQGRKERVGKGAMLMFEEHRPIENLLVVALVVPSAPPSSLPLFYVPARASLCCVQYG